MEGGPVGGRLGCGSGLCSYLSPYGGVSVDFDLKLGWSNPALCSDVS